MNIKLIAPRSTRRPMDSAWKNRMAPPLSLLVLGALTPPEHRVTVADENVERLRTDDAPDLVGITVKVDTFNRAATLAAGYRRRGIPVVMGGIHPTACPGECLPHADAVAVGEAEETWPAVLRDAAQGRLQRVYRQPEAVDPARIPVPAWHLIEHRRYLFTNALTAGRGCPWRCDFCYNSSPNLDARYRAKPLRAIGREIESLGTRHVMFIDDNFIGHPARARTLLEALRGMGLTWHAAVSADVGRHEDLLDLMAETGCKSLFIGFESVNRASLAGCSKAQNRVEDYSRTLRSIHGHGIMVNASLVFGFDEDDTNVFPTTLDWLVGQRVATMTAHILTPYPGTRLYDRLLAEGRIIDRDLERYNTAHVVFRPRHMTPDELADGYRWIYRQFYSWANIWRRWPEAPGQAAAYLEFALLYRKFGSITAPLAGLFGARNLARIAKALAYPGWRDRRALDGLQSIIPAAIRRRAL